MASQVVPVHKLSEYVIIDVMKSVDIHTLKALVSSLPIFFRVFQRNRVTVFMAHLGDAYVKHGVPVALIEALHYVRLHELRDPDAFWSEPAPPSNHTPAFIPTAPSLGCLELLPSWAGVVGACYKRMDTTADEVPDEVYMAHLTLQEEDSIANGIKDLLRRESLRWLEAGVEIVSAVTYVAQRFDIELRPVASASRSSDNVDDDHDPDDDNDDEDDDVYPLSGRRAVKYLQPWVHELRCNIRGATKSHILDAFRANTDNTHGNNDDDGQENSDDAEEDSTKSISDQTTLTTFEIFREDIFANPWMALEEQAAAANRRQVAARLAGNTTLPTGRDNLLGQIFWSEDEEKQAFEEMVWWSGSAVIARLGRMTPEQRQEFLLVQYHASTMWY